MTAGPAAAPSPRDAREPSRATDRFSLGAALTRPAAPGELVAEIEGLRFVAIAAVLLHHLMASYLRTTGRMGPLDLPADWWRVYPSSPTIALAYTGHFGVHLFFTLSGFVLGLPFARAAFAGRPRPSLRAYFLRRVRRIEPPYVISMLVCFAVIVATNPGWREFVPHLLPSLFYVHGLVFADASWVNGVAWSLEVEIQFYLAVPLLALVFRVRDARARRALLVVLVLGLGLASRLWIEGTELTRLRMSLANFLAYFLAGFLLADLHLERWREREPSLAGDVAAIAASAAILVMLVRPSPLSFLLPAMLFVFCAGVLRGTGSGTLARSHSAGIVGGMGYTLYLFHSLVIELLAPWTMTLASAERPLALDFAIQCALLVPPILMSGAVLFVVAEKPFLRWSRRVAERSPRAEPERG